MCWFMGRKMTTQDRIENKKRLWPLPSGTFRHHGPHTQFDLVSNRPTNLKASLDPHPLQLLLPLPPSSAQAWRGWSTLAHLCLPTIPLPEPPQSSLPGQPSLPRSQVAKPRGQLPSPVCPCARFPEAPAWHGDPSLQAPSLPLSRCQPVLPSLHPSQVHPLCEHLTSHPVPIPCSLQPWPLCCTSSCPLSTLPGGLQAPRTHLPRTPHPSSSTTFSWVPFSINGMYTSVAGEAGSLGSPPPVSPPPSLLILSPRCRPSVV